MRRARDIWPWFLLVPYFAVLSLNVSPWFGDERRAANRANAQLALALVYASVALPLLNAFGITGSWIGRTHPWLLSLFLVVPAMVVVNLWMNTAREAEYRKTYCAVAPLAKVDIGLATASIMGVCLWLFWAS